MDAPRLTSAATRRLGEREGGANVLELDAGGKLIDGENVEADGDVVADGAGKLAEIGRGHLAQDLLLVRVDGGLGWRKGLFSGGRGAGLDLEDHQGGAVPGDEVEVAGEALGAPASGDYRVAEGAKVEVGGVFSAFAGEQVGRFEALAVGKGAEGGVSAVFER